jgi:streptogramin lyase
LTQRSVRCCFSIASTLCLSGLLTGCALETTALPAPADATTITGSVHGGYQIISGAKVYLLAVNPTGYGGPGIAASSSNASVSLLNPASTGNSADNIGSYVLTNTSGGFTVAPSGAPDYSCTTGYAQGSGTAVTLSGSEQVYFYVLGGSQAGVSNPASGLLVALGPCNSPTTHVLANEISTAATAYAFAGFATDATHIGSSGSALALTGLNNAFANVGNLASTATGSATASSATMITPSATLNTIGDILSACVQSNGSTASGSNCNQLFAHTNSSGDTGTAPTDTATAAIHLAHNPWPSAAGMTALFGLVAGTGAPFSALSTQPNDFTLGLNISGGGITEPYGIAIDAAGDVWTTNLTSISKISSTGVAISGPNGYTGGGIANDPYDIAIDASGNAWVTNNDVSILSEFNSSGQPVAANGYPDSPAASMTVGGDEGIAIDASGTVWIANNTSNGVYTIQFLGAEVVVTAYGTGNQPSNIAIDVSRNAWVAELVGADWLLRSQLYGGDNFYGPISNPFDIALDGSGYVWVTSYVAPGSVNRFTNTGNFGNGPVGSPYSGGGLSYPYGIAIDSAGNAWVANQTGSSVTEFTSTGTALSPSTGYTGGSQGGHAYIAIDGSGDVWVTNDTDSVTELIGAAAPVVTPKVANLISPYGTKAVNLP